MDDLIKILLIRFEDQFTGTEGFEERYAWLKEFLEGAAFSGETTMRSDVEWMNGKQWPIPKGTKITGFVRGEMVYFNTPYGIAGLPMKCFE